MSDTTTPTLSARERLERARAEAADLAARQTAAETTGGPRVAQPGDVVHFVRSGFSVPQSLPDELWGGPGNLQMTRGDELVITERHRDAARDRLGGPGWLGLVFDPDAQVRRFGHVVIVPGPAPAGLEPWIRGDRDWSDARERAMLSAGAQGDPQQRADAIAHVNLRFGPPPATNSSSTRYTGDAGDSPRDR